MYTSFYITENRLDELKQCIRTKTKTVRFNHNPLKEGNNYFIALTLDVSESTILNELQNKWHDEDNNIPQKDSIFKKLLKFIKL